MWVRGLKLEVTLSNNSDYKVAPRVGAWIETDYTKTRFFFSWVAPRVGAWIETKAATDINADVVGRTPCGCVD